MSGRGSDETITKQDAYEKNSRKSSSGNFMRTFSRTKTSQLVTTWDDTSYLTIMNNTFKCIADATGAVDTATVIQPVMENILNLAWELYYTNANLKDLVADDETAWKLYFAVCLQVCLDIQIQYKHRLLLPAYTETDTVSGGPNSSIAPTFFTQSAFDILVTSFKDFPIPKGVYELVDIWATWIVELAPAYERFTIRIPPGYMSPFNTQYDLADLEAMRDLMRIKMGSAITHAKKFGLKMGTWRDPIAPRILQVSDSDVIAFCNHAHFQFYDNQPAQQMVNPDGGFLGNNLTTEYTGVEYFFKDTPSESPIHVLAPWLGIYNATNNPYGGVIIYGLANTAEYSVNMIEVGQYATNGTTYLMAELAVLNTLKLLKSFHDSNSAAFQVSMGGTNFTASQVSGGSWPLATANKLFMGLGRGATETNNDLINYIGKLLV